MNNIRILLVESDPAKADDIASRLASWNHSPLPVPDLAEAAEAIFIQKFDLILLGSEYDRESIAALSGSLRNLESAQSSEDHACIVSCAPAPEELPFLDGYLSPDFSSADLLGILSANAGAAHRNGHRRSDRTAVPASIFEPSQFEAQCACDLELMIEIIGLFFAECGRQIEDMRAALQGGDLERLSRIAHTIKGSLATLHAPRARYRAQALESAARDGNAVLCAPMLDLLEADSAGLNEHLSAFREACLGR